MKVKNKVLTIDKDCIFKTKVDNLSNFKDSIFEESYLKAAKSLKEIIKYHEKNFELNRYDCNFYGGYTEEQNLNDYDYNNIIAFVGDRGSGKTSTMKSFRNSLNLKSNYEDFQLEEYKGLEKYKFELLKTIDPTLFSNKESIVEIIVAQMFEKFKEYSGENSLSRKKDLANKFEKVYKDIKIINNSKNSCLENTYDNLEALMDLSSAIALKEDMKELVSYYMNYMNSNNKKENFLVIAIDDLDMNLTVGQKMIEDIRKYLIIPNVIILMAIKIEQLEEVVSRKFIIDLSENEKLYKDLGQIQKFKENIDIKTERYLEKIIPLDRRIYMPQISLKNVDIKINTKDFSNIKFNNNSENEEWSISNLREIVTSNLFTKVNYIITTEQHYKAIVTENLRGFIEFIVLLNSMKNEKNKINNINMFKEYFEKVIINDVKEIESREFLNDLIRCDSNKVNKKSLTFLNQRIDEKITNASNIEDIKGSVKVSDIICEITEWIKKNQIFINEDRIVFGDIITWIKMYEIVAMKIDDIKFIEIFKGILSLKFLHENFNDKEILYKNIGVDFIGQYFEIVQNSAAKYLTEGLYQDKLDIDELLKSVRQDEKNKILIKKMLPIVLNPNFKEDTTISKYYHRFLRREKKEYIDMEEIDTFRYFTYKPLNTIGYIIFNNTLEKYIVKYKQLYEKDNEIYAIEKYIKNKLIENDKLIDDNIFENPDSNIKYIINLDFWMNVLQYTAIAIDSFNGARDKRFSFRIDVIKKIKKISEKLCDEYYIPKPIYDEEKNENIMNILEQINIIIREKIKTQERQSERKVIDEVNSIVKSILMKSRRIKKGHVVKVTAQFGKGSYPAIESNFEEFTKNMNDFKTEYNKCTDSDIKKAEEIFNEWKEYVESLKIHRNDLNKEKK